MTHPDPAELAELRMPAPAARYAPCNCDACERARRERIRALTPSRARTIDPDDVSDAAFERFLPERRK